MFSGIVHSRGEIRSVATRGRGKRMEIGCALERAHLSTGASVSVSGVCLTVSASAGHGKHPGEWFADLSEETLDRTSAARWRAGDSVNIEPALRAGDPLGGHLVFGHVDGVVECLAVRRVGPDTEVTLTLPTGNAALVATKGSVALDGVSLTVNRVTDSDFNVLLIPHTLEVTNLARLHAGCVLNFEADMLMRYAARAVQALHPRLALGANPSPADPARGL